MLKLMKFPLDPLVLIMRLLKRSLIEFFLFVDRENLKFFSCQDLRHLKNPVLRLAQSYNFFIFIYFICIG